MSHSVEYVRSDYKSNELIICKEDYDLGLLILYHYNLSDEKIGNAMALSMVSFLFLSLIEFN